MFIPGIELLAGDEDELLPQALIVSAVEAASTTIAAALRREELNITVPFSRFDGAAIPLGTERGSTP